MKKIFTLIALFMSTGVLAQEGARYKIHFVNTPVEIVLAEYAKISDKQVDLVQRVRVSVTITHDGVLTADEFLQLVEKNLNEVNVGLFSIGKDRMVAAWIDPELAPREPIAPAFTEDVLKEMQQRQRDAIREGRPPLPTPRNN